MAPQLDATSDRDASETAGATTKISINELVYGFESFRAIVQPVTITMILASLAVVFINTPETRAAGEAAISQAYTVTGSASSANSNAAALGQALVNALVIVGVICGITFLLVLLYKWRCMRLLTGYMVLASAMLLGYLAATMWMMAIDIYELHVDTITFAVAIFNFCIVGCTAIFYSKGIPMTVTQGYLVASSVIIAWQLSYFDSWTAWLLLIMLALYDLFAVLSPCGPLKALVKLMQRDNAPAMPGLLYEANVQARRPARSGPNNTAADTVENRNDNQLEAGTSRPERPAERQSATLLTRDDAEGQPSEPSAVHVAYTNGQLLDSEQDGESASKNQSDAKPDELPKGSTTAMTPGPETESPQQPQQSVSPTNAHSNQQPVVELESGTTVQVPSAYIPLAIAKRYRLPTVDGPWPQWMPNQDGTPCNSTFTVAELRSLVQVRFSPGGGRIEAAPARRLNEEPRYEVHDRNGVLKRVLFVNAQGEVYQDMRGQNPGHAEDDDDSRNNIKLGLGDFIFYSILVAKAASYSFTAFAACSLVILIGLLGTLVLLGVYGKALPALPISIFLGVTFYLLTRYLMQPWIHAIFIEQTYV